MPGGAVLQVDPGHAEGSQFGHKFRNLGGVIGEAVLDVRRDVDRQAAQLRRECGGYRLAGPASVGRPALAAMPKLVVPMAGNPAAANAKADPTSHALGSRSGATVWWSSRKVAVLIPIPCQPK